MARLQKGTAAKGQEKEEAVARASFTVTLSVDAIDGFVEPQELGGRIVADIVREESRRDFRGSEPRLRVELAGVRRTAPASSFYTAARDFRGTLQALVDQLDMMDRANAPSFFDVEIVDERPSMLRCDFGKRRVVWVPKLMIHPESDERNGKLAVLTWWAYMKGLIDG